MKPYLAEFLGTFFLVFAGTGAIVINQTTQGAVSHVGISLVFGLVVFALIQTFGAVSGCHINPAVSIAAVFWGKLPLSRLLGYGLAQMFGALGASFLLKVLFPENQDLGGTHPSGSPIQSLVLEYCLTLLLMLAIIGCSMGGKATREGIGLTIGGVIALEALFAGPISGASMNPARSLAPALVSGQWAHQWIYLIGPLFGALTAVLLGPLVFSGTDSQEPIKEAP